MVWSIVNSGRGCRGFEQEKKVDTDKALDANSVVKASSGTKSGKKNTKRRSRNDTDVDDADIRPVYDEEPMAKLKAQIQKKVFATAALKSKLRKLSESSVDTKFAKPSILGKPLSQPLRNQSVVKQSNVFKSERPKFSKPRFAS
ncbi:hypothetical protein Tco_0725355 [Tanacetum coccineum]|uniref:Uncharacterized protein n=1 Tax=Tanacetum coccineum TaxID=301880 RepID=A0ABQ4YCN8_9ASTR